MKCLQTDSKMLLTFDSSAKFIWKKEPNWTRATMKGNLINYPENVVTPMADLLLIKIFLNSVISMLGAQFANADISNFYLMTPLKCPEYAKTNHWHPWQNHKQTNWIRKSLQMDGSTLNASIVLLTSGWQLRPWFVWRATQQRRLLPKLHYTWTVKKPDMDSAICIHRWWFCIKYLKKEVSDYLINTLHKYYDVTVDLEGKECVKIKSDWDYDEWITSINETIPC